MNYVVHYCKNKSCNNAWIDKDLTNAQSKPHQWKYCKECCEKMGIDFDSQKPELKEYQKRNLQKGLKSMIKKHKS